MARGTAPVTLFDGGQDGFGYSLKVPGLHTYNWAINMNCEQAGVAYPENLPFKTDAWVLGNSAKAGNNPITVAFEWVDASGYPMLLWATGDGAADAKLLTYSAVPAGLNVDSQAIDPYTGGVLFRHDGTNADTPMAYFCNGSANDGLAQRNVAGTVALHTGGTEAKADSLWVIGSDLWLVAGYKIRKWNGGDPGLDASYDTAIEVGIPTYGINKVFSLGGSPVVLKGDGVFEYNAAPTTAEFRAITPWINPHPDNGKNAFADGRGRIYYDTVDGELYVIQYGNMSQQGPARVTTFDRDTPRGRLTAITADGANIYAATEPGQMRLGGYVLRTDPWDVKVKSNNGGVWTSHTTNVTDEDPSTAADWALLYLADAIYIGSKLPFSGIYVKIKTPRTSDYAGDSLKIAYSLSNGTFQNVVQTLYCFDSTQCLTRDGAIIVCDGLGTDLYKAAAPWATCADPEAAGDDGRYWMRIVPESTALLTGVAVSEIYLIPYRPAPDPDQFPLIGYKLAGALPSILSGTWRGEEIIWQDRWTLNQERVDQLLVTRAVTDRDCPAQRYVAAISKQGVWAMPVGPDVHPARALYPYLAAAAGLDVHALATSGNDFSEAGGEQSYRTKRIVGPIVVEQAGIQAADKAYLYTWWDSDAQEVEKHDISGKSVAEIPHVEGQGKVLYALYCYEQTTRVAFAPGLRRIVVPTESWETVDGEFELERGDLEAPLRR